MERGQIMTRALASVLLLLASVGAAVTPSSPSEAPPTTDEKAIRSLEEQERVAVLNGDVPALEKVWSDQFIVNNPQNAISADRAVVLDRVKRGLISYSAFERRIEAIRFHDDIAIVMGSETVVSKGEAPRANQTVNRRFTNIWKRLGSTWRMIARHANVVAGG
jgi:ketosteroid isomerase-like protein